MNLNKQSTASLCEKSIPRAENPESVGISSSVVKAMTEEMNYRGINVHSMMILRHGKVACEMWSKPLSAETPHMVYSVSKSFLATAYGLALDEGLITKETRFVDIFPEYKANKKDKNLQKLTVHHLLTMTAGKQSAMRGSKEQDRIKTFVNAKWIFAPGENWRYVNDNYYVASAMLSKVLGMSVTEFLKPRLYEPLGIETPFWETSPDGTEAGGWGLMLKTEDIAKLILCYHNNGVYCGKRVLPEWWVSEATAVMHDNSQVEKTADSRAGYGCGFWKCAGMPDTFRCEGIFCQYAISFKNYDACLVMTSDHSDLQETLDVIWKYMPQVFTQPDENAETTELTLPDCSEVTEKKRQPTERKINGKVYKLRRCRFANFIGFPVSVLPMPVVFFSNERVGNMTDVKFTFDSKGVFFEWSEDSGKNRLYIGMNGEATLGTLSVGKMTLHTRSFAYWENENTLVLRIRPLEAVAERILKFVFDGKKIKMYPSTVPATEEKAKKIGEKLKCILIGRWFHWWIDFLVPKVGRILNPVHRGKTKNTGAN